MIKVEIKKNKEEITCVLIHGHSGYKKAGSDIVCSAVSSIVATSINAILSFKETIRVSDDGELLEIQVLEHDLVTDTLLKNMLNLLKELEQTYKKNIKVEGE